MIAIFATILILLAPELPHSNQDGVHHHVNEQQAPRPPAGHHMNESAQDRGRP